MLVQCELTYIDVAVDALFGHLMLPSCVPGWMYFLL